MAKLPEEGTFTISREFGELGEWQVTLTRYWTQDDEESVTSKLAQITFEVGPDKKLIPHMSDVRTGKTMLMARVIKSWNLTDAQDVPLPVSLETIGKLPDLIFDWIEREWNNYQADLKKAWGCLAKT
jgi:hypothetical protein